MHTLQSVIWDFNGTILDDLELVVRTINMLLNTRGLTPTTVAQHREKFGFPVDEYYRALGFDLEHESFSDVSREYHDHYLAGIHECGVHAGAARLIPALHDRGISQFVLSAMQQQLLERALADLELDRYFTAIYGLDDLLARSKAQRGHALLADHAIESANALYIGDTEHDVEVARELGCISVGVGVGHQTAGRFDPARTYVCNGFDDLAACIDIDPGGNGNIRFVPALLKPPQDADPGAPEQP